MIKKVTMLFISLLVVCFVVGYVKPQNKDQVSKDYMDKLIASEKSDIKFNEKREESKEETHWAEEVKNFHPKNEYDTAKVKAFEWAAKNKLKVINWKDAKVTEKSVPQNDDSVISTGKGILNGKDIYIVDFHTSDEEILGTLIVYVEKNSYKILGVGLRD
ncbi:MULTISPECIES: hypothetical protein [Clostridium]|uniref:hypothetical protein n=1 Tax=Clostridium TaxID=1485 RepID=UPI0008254662|nr:MULTISPECIES: hypothetical protein [Clostridium]PJI09581.1 hypothetical protein CUB90_17665 [Clostridium sp. CT7]